MKKKAAPKKVVRSRKNVERYRIVGFTIITVGCVLLFCVGSITYHFATQSHVLGTSTYLADDAPDSSGNTESHQTPTGFTESRGMLDEGPKPTSEEETMKQHHTPLFISGTPQDSNFGSEKSSEGSDSSMFKNIADIKHGQKGVGEEDLLIQQSTDSDKFRIKTGSIEAESHFPLSLNTTTNQLQVTTPNGTKIVTVLPDQAVANLLQKGIISSINQSSSSSQINLTENNNEPVFSIQGVSDKKFLGLIPDTIQKTVNVSAQTGQLVDIKESILQKLLDIFSF